MATKDKRFAWFSWGVVVFTLGVILWGAYVRASGSGAGCGSSWPTCNGEVIPRPKNMQTVIEFAHRATSGVDFLAVLVQLLWARRVFPAGGPLRRAAGAAMALMVTEALVGAGLVIFEHVAGDTSVARAIWTAAHLTNTFLLVASLTMVALWGTRGEPASFRWPGVVGGLGVAALLGTLLLGISGAITALGDTLFQSKTLVEGIQQDLSPTAHFLVKLRVLHPLAGLLVGGFLLASLGRMLERDATPWDRRMGWIVSGLFAVQVAVGFVNLGLLAPIPLQVIHLLMADLVWMALVVLVVGRLSCSLEV
ncbi:MAG: COX15/CtaA family protein [Myxococcales bacterium]|nr:COX15/CtaA family protein [Polyangiaceae bacterium]MDW8248438.1 COX15/CtaA family protein [Myxococcales bacterium]